MIQPNGSISKECFFTRRHQRKIRDIAEDDNGIFLSSKELLLSTKHTIGKTDCNKLPKLTVFFSIKLNQNGISIDYGDTCFQYLPSQVSTLHPSLKNHSRLKISSQSLFKLITVHHMRYKMGKKNWPKHWQSYKTTILLCQHIHSCVRYPTN